jgi:hypothetical protein
VARVELQHLLERRRAAGVEVRAGPVSSTLRSPGDLNAPVARPAGAAGKIGDPNASTPAAPGSFSIALTPVRKNPSARGSRPLPREAVVRPAADNFAP